jgi:hypothetical protein
MSSKLEEWSERSKEAFARFRDSPDARKILLAALLAVSAAGFAVALSPERSRTLAPILTLVSDNDVDAVRRAVADDKAVLRETDLDGRTPLHIAVMLGSKDLVATLLEAGADVAARDAHGTTPLAATLEAGTPANQAEIAEALIAAGADRNERSPGGDTLLHRAATADRVHPRLLQVLAAASGGPAATNNAGETPLQLAQRSGNKRAIRALQSLAPGQTPTPTASGG